MKPARWVLGRDRVHRLFLGGSSIAELRLADGVWEEWRDGYCRGSLGTIADLGNRAAKLLVERGCLDRLDARIRRVERELARTRAHRAALSGG